MTKEIAAYIAVGLILVALGLVTWLKKQVILIHGYQHRNVKEEDIPAYTRAMGIGQIAVGAGFSLSGLFQLLSDGWIHWVFLGAGILGGAVVMHVAQRKYNGGWFS